MNETDTSCAEQMTVSEIPKIQVVEDDPLVADELYEALRSLGYRALPPVPTVTEAVVASEREQPDLVIIDILLPGDGDGIELGALLKRKHDLAIVYLTSARDRETIHRASQSRPDGYLIKPVGRDSLFATIEVALQRDRTSVPEEDAGRQVRLSLRIKRAIAHIEDHIGENITTDQLAQIARLSRDHFVRTFRKSTGETPHQYLVGRRMARARRMLETTDLRITDVARQCGYDSLTYFTTLFRREVGVSPGAYRRSNR